MENEYLKILWLLRFERIRKSEEETAWKYQEMYMQCASQFGGNDPIPLLLERLVHEERMHERLADELISICRRTHPELGEDR